MKNNVFKVVLLQALPASGKSEVRNFMAHVEPERLQNEFHIGENLQLDDFPYVHMMRRIDEELAKLDKPRVFYPGEAPFLDGRDWGTLCNLLNEDYHDLMNRNIAKPDSAAKLLFDRFDRAAAGAGITNRLKTRGIPLPKGLKRRPAQCLMKSMPATPKALRTRP